MDSPYRCIGKNTDNKKSGIPGAIRTLDPLLRRYITLYGVAPRVGIEAKRVQLSSLIIAPNCCLNEANPY